MQMVVFKLGEMVVCKGGLGKGRELWTAASVSNQGCLPYLPSARCLFNQVGCNCVGWVFSAFHLSLSLSACLCLCQPVSVFVFLSVYLSLSVSLSLFASTTSTEKTEVTHWRNFWYCIEDRAALEKALKNAWGLPVLLFCLPFYTWWGDHMFLFLLMCKMRELKK